MVLWLLWFVRQNFLLTESDLQLVKRSSRNLTVPKGTPFPLSAVCVSPWLIERVCLIKIDLSSPWTFPVFLLQFCPSPFVLLAYAQTLIVTEKRKVFLRMYFFLLHVLHASLLPGKLEIVCSNWTLVQIWHLALSSRKPYCTG